VSKLEAALESDALSEFDKNIIDRALDKAEQLGLQRSSTVDRTKRTAPAKAAPIEDTPVETTPATDTVVDTPQETIEDNTVAPDKIAETAEEVHTPTEEEVAESERTITTPDLDNVGEKFEEVNISDEIELFDALDILADERTSAEELADKVTGVVNPAVDTSDQGNIIPETDP